MSKTDILLATTNPAKLERLRWILEGLPLSPVMPQRNGPTVSSPEETGGSHEEIARQKAQAWSTDSGKLAISSDGGLMVPALGSQWDSILTHRFAGEGADDEARLTRLIELMEPYSGEERRATWVEAIAIAIAEKGQTMASWQVQGATGLLLEKPAPAPVVPGFWAFSLWWFPDLGKSYNELDEAELKSIDDHWSQLKSLVQGFFSQ